MTNNKIGYKPVVYLPGPAPLNRRIYAEAKYAVAGVLSAFMDLLMPWLAVLPVALVIALAMATITYFSAGNTLSLMTLGLTTLYLTAKFTAWGGVAVAVLRVLGAIRF